MFEKKLTQNLHISTTTPNHKLKTLRNIGI